ncbi:hypothetical protein GOV13_05570 [Candidatus Pacearchaeota archaeon]|nr:hypothetical protein [Candidatus Pacearchaeota archaeon]
MNKKIIMPIVLLTLLSLAVFVSAECIDSDGGKEYYIKSYAITSQDSTTLYIQEDVCAELKGENIVIGHGSCYGSNCYVREGYCDDNIAKHVDFKCLNGCKNGACLEKIDDSKTCIVEPGKAYYPGTEKCCGDLKSIFGSELEDGRCWCIEDNNNCGGAPICAPCGNGNCENEYNEDKCNCPEDCDVENTLCVVEGGILLPNDGQSCCGDLDTRWNYNVLEDGSCESIQKPSVSGKGFVHQGICIRCGNGKCEEGENGCNCPEDCREECKKHGEVPIYTAPGDDMGTQCCEGLKHRLQKEWFIGDCVNTFEKYGVGGYAGLCLACGDDECDLEYETVCNCPEDCSLSDVECELISLRKGGKYCSYNKEWEKQKEASTECENNFECKSNVCISGECISQGLIKKILSWFERLFG